MIIFKLFKQLVDYSILYQKCARLEREYLRLSVLLYMAQTLGSTEKRYFKPCVYPNVPVKVKALDIPNSLILHFGIDYTEM